MSVQLQDIKLEIKVEKPDMEDGDNSTTWNVHSDQDSIKISAVIKEEYDSEEDLNTHKNDNFEQINIEEQLEKQNTIQEDCDENFKDELIDQSDITCKSEIDIIEEPLPEVKEESMSDSETPQDDSTSQAVRADAEITKTNKNFRENGLCKEKGLVETESTCEICGKKFRNKWNLSVHMRIHSGEKSHECEICGKKFLNKWNLGVHMRIHSGEKPHECEICKKKFIHKWHRDVHLRKHTGERPYECEICKRTFARTASLTIHMRKHNGDKPYSCEICKKSFSQIGALNIHTQGHTGERPFECKTCKKKFIHSGDLKRHMLKHSGERPHQCEICKKKFSLKSNLNVHKKLHSMERPYKCEKCKKKFIQSEDLSQHMLRVHS